MRSYPPTDPAERRPRGQLGLTLVEVMITLVIIVVGLLGLMKVAAVTSHSAQRSQRMGQASTRAVTRLEALKAVPTATLQCLAGGGSPAGCKSSCVSAGGENEACNLALALSTTDGPDSTNTAYTYGFLVRQIQAHLFDIHVMVTYTDDTADPPRPVNVVLRSAVYRE